MPSSSVRLRIVWRSASVSSGIVDKIWFHLFVSFVSIFSRKAPSFEQRSVFWNRPILQTIPRDTLFKYLAESNQMKLCVSFSKQKFKANTYVQRNASISVYRILQVLCKFDRHNKDLIHYRTKLLIARREYVRNRWAYNHV